MYLSLQGLCNCNMGLLNFKIDSVYVTYPVWDILGTNSFLRASLLQDIKNR